MDGDLESQKRSLIEPAHGRFNATYGAVAALDQKGQCHHDGAVVHGGLMRVDPRHVEGTLPKQRALVFLDNMFFS